MPAKMHPVPVPNKSGHYNAWTNSFSTKVGTLTPCLCKEVFPGDDIQLSMAATVQLPPMATDFYGRVSCKFEAFFVPNRLLWAGWKYFITDQKVWPGSLAQNRPVLRPDSLPSVMVGHGDDLHPDQTVDLLGPGSLCDYLNLRLDFTGWTSGSGEPLEIKNILPLVAYHRIYDDWYRNKRLQTPLFAPNWSLEPDGSPYSVANLPFMVVGQPLNPGGVSQRGPWFGYAFNDSPDPWFYDQSSLFDLRQRNWKDDYFTTCTFDPQAGNDAVVGVSVSDSTGEFTISSLRAANSLQQFEERNNVAGSGYADQIYARFGVRPADEFTNCSVYLGSTEVPVYVKSVYQNNLLADGSSPAEKNNPFGSVGSKYGSPIGSGDGDLLRRVGGQFKATEHGYLLVIASIVPEVLYSTGVDRMFMRSKLGDMPDPMFQAVGQQEISTWELYGNANALANGDLDNMVFGYNDRYIELNEYKSEVHGLLRDGESLASFSLQRSFDSAPELGNEFLQIPTNYLDQVGAVIDSVSEYGAWIDCGFSMRKSSVFAEYAIPTLGFPSNMHNVMIPDGGTKID